MAFTILNTITFSLSKILEAFFDELEYRLAKRAFLQAAEAKPKRGSRTTLAGDEVMATSSKVISIRAA